jgi:predicted DNA-binding transcriptional regulator YafY
VQRTDRLFQLIQLLRAARRPVTAAALALELEVSKRTLYRDVATLMSLRVPIEGAAGIGYVMRPGYDLPPLMFTRAEIEALLVGMALLRRTGDGGLRRAAASALQKIGQVLPREARPRTPSPLYVSSWELRLPVHADLAIFRAAIAEERTLLLRYCDAAGAMTRRRIRPLAVVFYADAPVIAAWCELRGDFRHFRPDRIRTCRRLDSFFRGEGDALRTQWLSRQPDLSF